MFFAYFNATRVTMFKKTQNYLDSAYFDHRFAVHIQRNF